MIHNIIARGGSSSVDGSEDLNFSVVRYDVGATIPATATENTIAVFAELAMASYVFSSTEPAEPVDGMVWITTGKASTSAFSVLKNNSIIVYPLCGLQYISGEWKYVDTKIYQGGWIDLLPEVAFFANGILNTNTFGSLTVGNHNVSIVNGLLQFDNYVIVTATKLFDVSSFNTIELAVSNFDYAYVKMTLVDENGNSHALVESGAWSSGATINYDISEYTGKYYLKITSSGKNGDITTASSIKFKV